MKRHFWIGLITGGVSIAMLVIIAGMVFAQNDRFQPSSPDRPSNLVNAPQVSVITGTVTYQGQLKKNNTPVNDTCSLTFSWWYSSTAGSALASNQVITPVSVVNGLFTVQLINAGSGDQFAPRVFDGNARWLQTVVRCAGDASPVTLTRQLITAAPYALSLQPGAVISGAINSGAALFVNNPDSHGVGDGIYGVGTRTGVWGYSDNQGVYGESTSGIGMNGFSYSGRGTIGSSLYGVGLVASGPITGTALQIQNGGIQVMNAGLNSNTTVFIHKVLSSTIAAANESIITNQYTDLHPNAILIVTPNYNPGGGAGIWDSHTIGVYYTSGHWRIDKIDATPLISGEAFNVMVVNP